MDAPREPLPADFGIADKDVLPKLVFGHSKNGRFGEGFELVTVIFTGLIFLNLLFPGDLSENRWIAALVLAMPMFMLAAGCFFILGAIENKVREAISPTFRRASQYRAAMEDYRKAVAEYKNWVAAQERERLRRQEQYWRGLSGLAFENELARLFRGLGYTVSQTPRTGDGGVDLILRKDDRVTVVQCKAHDKKIPIGVARELVASIQDFNAHDAIIACLEGVTKPVQQYIATKPIRVIDVRGILSLQRGLIGATPAAEPRSEGAYG
jgi:HJR/Mrr/RecB family endonuclease